MRIWPALVGTLFAPWAAAGPLPSAETVLHACDQAESFTSSFAEAKQIITTTSGEQRTLVMRSWAIDNGKKQLSEYLAPADIKGQRILTTDDGDNIWMFNPETRRTRKLGSHMKKRKVMGSDFTYEDQAGGTLSEKYVGTVLREEQEGQVSCWVLELRPTAKGPSYAKVIAWVGKQDHLVRRVDYFDDKSDRPFKRLILSAIKQVGSKRVAHQMTMTNLLDQTKTVMLIDRIQFGVKLPGSLFESRNLDK